MSELPPQGPDQSNDPDSHEPLATKEQARLVLGEFDRILKDAPSEPFLDTTIREGYIDPFHLSLWTEPIQMPANKGVDIRIKANVSFIATDKIRHQFYLKAIEDETELDGWSYSLAYRQTTQGEEYTDFDEGFESGARVEVGPLEGQDEIAAHADEIDLGLTDATFQEAEDLIIVLEAIEEDF